MNELLLNKYEIEWINEQLNKCFNEMKWNVFFPNQCKTYDESLEKAQTNVDKLEEVAQGSKVCLQFFSFKLIC